MKRIRSGTLAFADDQSGERQDLATPWMIQQFLLDVPYSSEPRYRCPRSVLRDRVAHCFDGALFAAAALRCLGFPPLIVEMLPNRRDDDHLLAVYKSHGRWGAIAKSNFTGLTWREPVYRDVRELVMSYFEQYYNVAREKTLRGYTVPLDLRAFDRFAWTTSDQHLERIARRLDRTRRVRLIEPSQARRLAPVDERSYQAGLMGADPAGLFKP